MTQQETSPHVDPNRNEDNGDPQLWLLMRYLERALRSLSDMHLALWDLMAETDPETRGQAYVTIMKGYPPPPPPCTPPTPCTKSIEQLEGFADQIERLTEAMCDGFRTQLRDAEEMGITNVTFRMREYPIAPDGSLPK